MVIKCVALFIVEKASINSLISSLGRNVKLFFASIMFGTFVDWKDFCKKEELRSSSCEVNKLLPVGFSALFHLPAPPPVQPQRFSLFGSVSL